MIPPMPNLELTLEQNFNLEAYKQELAECENLEIMRDTVLQLAKQGMIKDNYIKQLVKDCCSL